MATSGRYHDSYADLRDRWDLDEVYAALDVIAAYDEADRAAAELAREEARAKRR